MFRQCPKMVAVVLLLVFTQKAGLRLWMHDWFHEAKTARDKTAPGSAQIQMHCDCFDEAMMPLLESPSITVPPPLTSYCALNAIQQSPILTGEKIYYSLKGPPAA